MPREANLFEEASGSPLEGYFLLKANSGNVPPRWIENAKESRRRRHKIVAAALKEGNWGDIAALRDWEASYRKECFYNGIRILFELERNGKSNR
jgi:hypothetical protein